MRQIQNNQKIGGCGFHHIAFRTPDWDGSMRFWCDGLGFTPALNWGEAPRRAAMLDLGDGNYFEIFERDASANENVEERESSAMHFCLRVDDCAAAVARAVEAGAEVKMQTKEVNFDEQVSPAAKIAFITGPGGVVVEFFQSDAL